MGSIIQRWTTRAAVGLLAVLWAATAWSQAPSAADAQHLWVLARDAWAPAELQILGYAPLDEDLTATARGLRQACVYLQAAVTLDERNENAWNDLQAVCMSDAVEDEVLAARATERYSDLAGGDEWAVRRWIAFRLEQIQDRASRQGYLNQVVRRLRGYELTKSEATMQLGLLTLETGDVDTARAMLEQAAMMSLYNAEPWARILELPDAEPPTQDAQGQALSPEAAAEAVFSTRIYRAALRWRLQLRNNPYDLDATLSLLNLFEKFAYVEVAQPYYEHAYRLLKMSGDEAVEREVRVNQLVGLYASETDDESFLARAKEALTRYPNALLPAALQARVARRSGRADGESALDEAIAAAKQTLADAKQVDAELAGTLAWVLSFWRDDAGAAVTYARMAQELFPDDAKYVALAAYAEALNGNNDAAAALLSGLENGALLEPLPALAQARIHLNNGATDDAVKVLQRVDLRAAGLFTSDVTTVLREAQGPDAEEESADEPPQKDQLEHVFLTQFDNAELAFVEQPEEFVYCSVKLKKKAFSFNDPIAAEISLKNIGQVTLHLGPGMVLDPHVLIVAEVQPLGAGGKAVGEAETVMVSHRYLLKRRLLEPGSANVVTEPLNIGALRRVLGASPQRSFQVTVRAILEPTTGADGEVLGRIAAIQPAVVQFTRDAFVPDGRRMGFYHRQLSQAAAKQAVSASLLFGALLRESLAAHQGKLNYRPAGIERNKVYEALVKNCQQEAAEVRAWTGWALHGLPRTRAATAALTALTRDEDWVVRLLALQSLASTSTIGDGLDRIAEDDLSVVVRRQALLMQGRPWPPTEEPAPAAETAESGEGGSSSSD